MVLISFFTIYEVIPMMTEKGYKNRIFEEMQDQSRNVISGIVGIIPERKENGLSNYNGIGSGVIFAKKENTYYIVTAKHVVNEKNNQ